MTVSQKLIDLNVIKLDIKAALEEKGQAATLNMATYADLIRAIDTAGGLPAPLLTEVSRDDQQISLSWTDESVASYVLHYGSQQVITSGTSRVLAGLPYDTEVLISVQSVDDATKARSPESNVIIFFQERPAVNFRVTDVGTDYIEFTANVPNDYTYYGIGFDGESYPTDRNANTGSYMRGSNKPWKVTNLMPGTQYECDLRIWESSYVTMGEVLTVTTLV